MGAPASSSWALQVDCWARLWIPACSVCFPPHRHMTLAFYFFRRHIITLPATHTRKGRVTFLTSFFVPLTRFSLLWLGCGSSTPAYVSCPLHSYWYHASSDSVTSQLVAVFPLIPKTFPHMLCILLAHSFTPSSGVSPPPCEPQGFPLDCRIRS